MLKLGFWGVWGRGNSRRGSGDGMMGVPVSESVFFPLCEKWTWGLETRACSRCGKKE
jgi:hypothetical protein